MNKRKLHHIWRYTRKIHPVYFLIVAIVLGAICVISLRHNNERMVVLREAVYVADKEGGDVEGTLYDLRSYVFAHMNTGLASGVNAVRPPIQLKYTYERLQAAQQKSLGEDHGALYGAAERTCNTQGNTTAQTTIACIEDYMAVRGVQLAPIPDGLYKFDFVSPKWSPDVAGWTLLVTVVSSLLFIGTAIYRWGVTRYLK